MEKLNKNHREFPIKLYGEESTSRVHLFVLYNKAEYEELLENMRNNWDIIDYNDAFLSFYDFRAYVTTVTVKSGAEHFLVFLKEKETSNIGTIAHECLHIMSAIFKSRGIKYDIDNDEVMTYFFEWLLNEVLKNIQNIKGKKNGTPIRPKKQ